MCAMNIYLPTWIYEKLPVIYMIAGGLLLIKSFNTLATYSGAILLAAGIQVWRERRRYRVEHDQIKRDIDQRYQSKSLDI